MNSSKKVRWAGYLTAVAGAFAVVGHLTGFGPAWLAPAATAIAAFASAAGHILGDDPKA